MHQRQPAAPAIGVEACHMQNPVVQQFAVGFGTAGRHPVTADKFVDVLKTRVFAGIDHRPPVFGHTDPGPFVRSAAQSRAFDGRAGGVHRVDFDHPAKTVGLVRVLHRIETRVELFPAIEGVLAHAPAPVVGAESVPATEVDHPVLFARQVGAPGCLAAGAIVQRAQHQAPGWIGNGAHHGVPCCRPAHGKRGVHRESARITRWAHHLPAIAFALDLIHRQPVGVLGFLDLLGRQVGKTTHMQQAIVGVFMVDRDHAAGRAAIQREVLHTVMVHSHLYRLVSGAVGSVKAERRHVARHTYGFTPGRNGGGNVAFRHHQRIRLIDRNSFETQLRPTGHAPWPGTSGQRGQQRRQRSRSATQQQRAPRRAGNVVNTWVGRAVAVLHAIEILGHIVFWFCRSVGGVALGQPIAAGCFGRH